MHNFQLAFCDTDSISICKPDHSQFSEEERKTLLAELNSLFPELIRWEDDGYYDAVLVVKSKNYCMSQNGKLTIRGSALKGSMKEAALKEFLTQTITALLDGKDPLPLYNNMAYEIMTLTDITRFCSKKTVTEAVLHGSRANETKVLDALKGSEYQQGDKIHVYFDTNDNVKLASNWQQDHNVDRLLKKLHDTLKVFSTVLDVTRFPNYSLKKNKTYLNVLVDVRRARPTPGNQTLVASI